MATLPATTTIEIHPGKTIEEPICLSHTASLASAGKFISPHVEIIARANSRATLLEIFTHAEQMEQAYRHNGLTKIHLAKGAVFNHIKVVLESHSALHASKVRAKLEGQFDVLLLSLLFPPADWFATIWTLNSTGRKLPPTCRVSLP